MQIITHMREKLQFIQQENNVLRSELGVLEQELVQKRDLVAQVKRERDEWAERARESLKGAPSSAALIHFVDYVCHREV